MANSFSNKSREAISSIHRICTCTLANTQARTSNNNADIFARYERKFYAISTNNPMAERVVFARRHKMIK